MLLMPTHIHTQAHPQVKGNSNAYIHGCKIHASTLVNTNTHKKMPKNMPLSVFTVERSVPLSLIELTRHGQGLPLIAPVRKKTIKLLEDGLIALITFLLTLEQYK